MSKHQAHYYTKTKYSGKSSSSKGKNKDVFPGQLCFDLDSLEEGSYTPRLPKEQVKEYWESFKDFVDASGIFARTYNLHKQLEKDPSIREIDSELSSQISPERRKELEELREGVERRQKAMHEMKYPECDKITKVISWRLCQTPDDVFKKAQYEWDEYKKKLNILINNSATVGVSLALSEEDKRIWMLKFVLLEPDREGPKRRNYYKDKHIERAFKALDKTGYAEPLSLLDIEAEYKAWRKKNAGKRKNTS